MLVLEEWMKKSYSNDDLWNLYKEATCKNTASVYDIYDWVYVSLDEDIVTKQKPIGMFLHTPKCETADEMWQHVNEAWLGAIDMETNEEIFFSTQDKNECIKSQDKGEQVRRILRSYGNEEWGDCIIDEILAVFK